MTTTRRAASIMLAVLISIAMLPLGAFAEDTTQAGTGNKSVAESDLSGAKEQAEQSDKSGTKEQADKEDKSGAKEDEEAKSVRPETKKSFKWYSYDLKFRTVRVLAKGRLSANSEPLALKIRVRRKYRKLTWKAPRDPGSIDGYIVLRKTGRKKVYSQIAVLKPGARSYIDKISRRRRADYTIVGYRETSDGYAVRISPCSGMGRDPSRKYQNPSKYVQITDKISKHGLRYYTSPVLVNKNSTKKQHIEAMIRTAYKYKGDRYQVCRSGRPGEGLDCSGLVMQACYGAGVDLWPVNPWRHRLAKYEWESRNIAKNNKLRTVRYRDRKRGDLIFFCNSQGTIIHVAIYLGRNRIIHSTTVGGHVVVTGMGGGAYGRPCKVKRIFN